jgi:Protein of unknown function (DUF3626)
MALSAAQQAALAHVTSQAQARGSDARAMLNHICRMCDVEAGDLQAASTEIERHARVALHFHPDRLCASGQTVAQELFHEGRYRSQFETRISNGGLTAQAGGRRDLCERRLFGGAYQRSGVQPAERPKYGSLDLLRHAEGPSPRFGSCYLLLAPEVSRRCTFSYLDSHEDPLEQGTYEEFSDILAALLKDAFGRESALGERDLTVPALVRRLRTHLAVPLGTHAIQSPVRNLDQYIEAQVHGEILLDADVDALVVDPAFAGTPTALVLAQLCERYRVQLCWHHGFRLAVSEVPSDFRGRTMPSLARRIAPSGFVDAAALGAAVRHLHDHPAAWADRGCFDEVLQELKLLWHVLVRYGQPLSGEVYR